MHGGGRYKLNQRTDRRPLSLLSVLVYTCEIASSLFRNVSCTVQSVSERFCTRTDSDPDFLVSRGLRFDLSYREQVTVLYIFFLLEIAWIYHTTFRLFVECFIDLARC